MKATIILTYNDESEICFDVITREEPSKALADVMIITRGTLMASSAERAVAYNEESFEICAYQK